MRAVKIWQSFPQGKCIRPVLYYVYMFVARYRKWENQKPNMQFMYKYSLYAG